MIKDLPHTFKQHFYNKSHEEFTNKVDYFLGISVGHKLKLTPVSMRKAMIKFELQYDLDSRRS